MNIIIAQEKQKQHTIVNTVQVLRSTLAVGSAVLKKDFT